MRRVNFILIAVAMIATVSCNSGKNSESSEKDKNSVAPATEEVVKNKDIKTGAIHITKQEFLDKVWDYEASPNEWVYKGDKPCIIDFYADWCGPCKKASPILEELAKEYAGEIYVYKVNTEQERELAGAFGIRSIPTFLYCPMNGDPQMGAGIGRTDEETRSMFKEVIDSFLLKK